MGRIATILWEGKEFPPPKEVMAEITEKLKQKITAPNDNYTTVEVAMVYSHRTGCFQICELDVHRFKDGTASQDGFITQEGSINGA